ncbi:Magnesium-chelatase 60 kDa subunit [Roseobacter fucihabitans]|uniref:Magnesium-chelatase 60 kDa subunit n=1 Tax=Roseobacter fucihabitans TaxID=1537242 RepID=A0ABZ2BQM2_9RHOB|nr:magnesium chelatase subunit D [Roseobacter litoralis]MBC6963515.1 Magnesium-chelatase 60 kDa subunit [Roseobacter litoralis]
MSTDAESWERAAVAMALLRFAPGYLGGAIIRMRASPTRDRLMHPLKGLDLRRLHPTIADEQLFGGLDLAATLAVSHLVQSRGHFDAPCTALLVMAERCGSELGAKLAHQLDRDMGHCIIALDEGVDADEATPAALGERLPFHIAPDGRMPAGWALPAAVATRYDPTTVICSSEDLTTLTLVAAQFGIDSMRAPLLALRVARAHAAFQGRGEIDHGDLEIAVSLVFPHRATQVPQEPEAETEDATPPPPEPETEDAGNTQESLDLPEGDMLVEAIKALLPPDLLAGLVAPGTSRQSGGDGAGQKRKGNRRGRPLPSRPGRLDGQARIDLVATLRAAAPWQPIRRRQQPKARGLLIRPADIRLKRYQEQSDRLLIFTVDASGSAAMSRLNEAKGAVELLLAQAYAARDHVALVSFRGTQAEVLLPPTRSLVQTKRRLASLPGGGGTPLAVGLQTAALLAAQSRSKGLTPTIIVLTDGRANVALDGTPNRARAGEDAEQMARMIRSQGARTLVIDMSVRPQMSLRTLAGHCDGQYLALPRATAQTLTGAVSAALEA